MRNTQNDAYVTCAIFVLFLLVGGTVAAQEFKPYSSEKITAKQFNSYFKEVSKKHSSTEQKHDEQKIITFSDTANGLQFTFTMKGNPAHPAWITRQIIEQDGSTSITQTGYYAGDKAEYDRLYAAYEQLNDEIRLRMAASTQSQSVELLRWTRHEINHRFFDSDTTYDCRALHKKIIQVLIAAGANEDVVVNIKHCAQYLPFSATMTIYINVAEPAQDETGGAVFPGRWEKVLFSTKNRTPSFLDKGDCELLKDFEKDLLPYYHARAVESKITCRRGGKGSIQLEYEIMRPVAD